MCTLLKLDYAKFGASNLFPSNIIEGKLLGSARPPPPPLGKGRVNRMKIINCPYKKYILSSQAHHMSYDYNDITPIFCFEFLSTTGIFL